MSTPIQLIVGLGNPGPQYANTRHNAGAWLVEALARQLHSDLREESKFQGRSAQVTIGQQSCRLLIPSTFMNHSGQAVQAISNFYKIPVQSILVAHDELDIPSGKIRLKKDGGHGGHNGLRNIIAHMNSNQFVRVRIGIGHPGNSHQVLNYVLGQANKAEQEKISAGIDDVLAVLPTIVNGDLERAMQALHTE